MISLLFRAVADLSLVAVFLRIPGGARIVPVVEHSFNSRPVGCQNAMLGR